MSSETVPLLDRLRQPEYTGENRCTPCTIVNVVIAAAISGAVALVALELAAVVFGFSMLAIYLRGYLVPGTPSLTKRYLPASVLRVFDKHPAAERQTTDQTFETLQKVQEEREQGVDPDSFLLDIDAIEITDDGEDYQLTEDFAASVDRHAQAVLDDGIDYAVVAEIFGDDPEDTTPLDRDYPAVEVGIRTRKWPSETAIVADIATHLALSERTDWLDVPDMQRPKVLESLRGFHEDCFVCGGSIHYSEDVVDSCCGQHEVKTFSCEDCGQHLLEFDHARVGAEGDIKGMTP